jgi:hypothetical protein
MKNEIIKGIHVYVVFKFNGTFSTFSNKITRGGGMNVHHYYGSHFVPLEVIVRITLNVIVRQMPLNVH